MIGIIQKRFTISYEIFKIYQEKHIKYKSKRINIFGIYRKKYNFKH